MSPVRVPGERARLPVGLGFYEGLRFHVDARKYREWGMMGARGAPVPGGAGRGRDAFPLPAAPSDAGPPAAGDPLAPQAAAPSQRRQSLVLPP